MTTHAVVGYSSLRLKKSVGSSMGSGVAWEGGGGGAGLFIIYIVIGFRIYNTKRKLSGPENQKSKLQRQLHSSTQSVASIK